ncbi:MAG: putative toxin-antitoxin system toxin component, PIN family [Anaerolineae bacterium]
MDYTLRIVPDVNVLVSGIAISRYAPSQTLQAWRRGEIEVAISEPILSDLVRVMQYPTVQHYFPLSAEQQADLVNELREAAISVADTTDIKISPDPDDDKLFACAVEASADYIVSMDKKHVLSVPDYQGIHAIHPTDFVKEFLQLKQAA